VALNWRGRVSGPFLARYWANRWPSRCAVVSIGFQELHAE
jgi:hypothetical protein